MLYLQSLIYQNESNFIRKKNFYFMNFKIYQLNAFFRATNHPNTVESIYVRSQMSPGLLLPNWMWQTMTKPKKMAILADFF